MPNIKLVSSDNNEFLVDIETAKTSITIKTMLETCREEINENVIPLTNVSSKILEKVIQWATYHKNDPPAPKDEEFQEPRTDDIIPWDAEFVHVINEFVFKSMIFSNSLFF